MVPTVTAWVFAGGFLLNGNNRAQARYLIYIRPLHTAHKLARVGRKCFHITALPLGINGIKRQ
jgi:hypothetical protein